MPEPVQVVCPHCDTINRLPADRLADAPRCGKCRAALFEGRPASLSEARFQRHLHHSGIPLLVDFWASWCGPCRTMAPAFKRAAAELEPQVRLLKLNADEAPNVSARLGVRGIPAMYLFQNGAVVAQTSGAMPAESIVRWTRDHLPQRHAAGGSV